MGPFDPRIIKSITNNGSEGTESAHSQAKKPFPSSHTAATPENPEQAQNEETQERKQPRTTVVLSPGSSIKSPLGMFGGAGRTYLLLMVSFLFEC